MSGHRQSRDTRYPVPKQSFPATLRLAEHLFLFPTVCCTCRPMQTVVFHLLVPPDLGAAPLQTDCSYSFHPVFIALPSAEGTELQRRLHQGRHIQNSVFLTQIFHLMLFPSCLCCGYPFQSSTTSHFGHTCWMVAVGMLPN